MQVVEGIVKVLCALVFLNDIKYSMVGTPKLISV